MHESQPNNTTFMGNCDIEYINKHIFKRFPVVMFGAPAYDIDGNVLKNTSLIPVFIPNQYMPNFDIS